MALQPIPVAPVKKPHSNRGRWRAVVLILVHVAIVAHILHWKATGSTLTPVEPSEAMKTLELGTVNAGFVLFAALILSTLVFGRFFCGWACHLVALQDLCSWLLGKLGIRPKPFRSRLLVFVPLFAALYMFVWPSVQRIFAGGPLMPRLQAHFQTEHFWATFAGPGMASLTLLVCGFLVVLLLGNKGFCTYGCPYGAFFYQADRVAPGKIRVTDACNGCGHCTAICTSNVRVHEEVAKFGMVVDPGCMKCTDCIDVCPNEALYFGFGKPQIAVRPKRTKAVYDFSLGEEAGMGLLFLLGFYAFRGLYDAVPFLLALGLSSVGAYFGIHAWRLASRPQQRLQRWQLKAQGKLRPAGVVFAAVAVLWFGFVLHSVFLQATVHEARASLAVAEASKATNPALAEQEARSALEHLQTAQRWSLFDVAGNHRDMGSLMSYLGRDAEAESEYRRALALNDDVPTRYALAKFVRSKGTWQEALDLLKDIESASGGQLVADGSADRIRADAYVGLQRFADAEQAYEAYLSKSGSGDQDAKDALALSRAYRMIGEGRAKEARAETDAELKSRPSHPGFLVAWARAVQAAGELDGTLQRLLKSPLSDDDAWVRIAYLYAQKGDVASGEQILLRLAERNPGKFGGLRLR